ncbi:MAG: caspase family protein [Christensenellaceae bacterium]|nr:caspase family protein [Christensenellaceae bacterium]
MGRRLLLAVLLAWLFLPFSGALAAQGTNRALLVGCDHFVTQEDTSPSSENNVIRMAEALSGGAMNLERLVTRSTGLSSPEELAELISDAFEGATEDDVSYFYISTHGLWRQGTPNSEMTLLLSDGRNESGVTAQQLRTLFDQVPGTKVLMLDACHAGAVIGKGVHAPFDNVFEGPDYKVICSSGGAEESWFWSGTIGDAQLTGAGYFSGALVNGLSVAGGYGADDNNDGVITLTELKRYLLDHHGASTVRVYPEEDDFAVMSYDAASFTGRRRDASVTSVDFGADVLSAESPTVNFIFNVVRATQVAYQFVYHRSGRWDFDRSRLLYDDAERFGTFGDARGFLSPGMKERAITLDRADTGSYGYVLLQLIAIDSGVPSLTTSRVLCVPPEQGDPALDILTEDCFAPESWDELCFVVHHRFPCELTVTVEDMEGRTVRRLASREPTRPEQLQPEGSAYCWNGRANDSSLAPAGQYRIRVKAYVGSEHYEAVSEPFELLGAN